MVWCVVLCCGVACVYSHLLCVCVCQWVEVSVCFTKWTHTKNDTQKRYTKIRKNIHTKNMKRVFTLDEVFCFVFLCGCVYIEIAPLLSRTVLRRGGAKSTKIWSQYSYLDLSNIYSSLAVFSNSLAKRVLLGWSPRQQSIFRSSDSFQKALSSYSSIISCFCKYRSSLVFCINLTILKIWPSRKTPTSIFLLMIS